LIVEENAHRIEGHFPVRFAQLGEGYTELGYRVEVLTTWGWSRADETRNSFTVHRLGPVARQFRRVAGRLRAQGDATATRRFVNSVGDALATATVIAATRSRARRTKPSPDVVLIMGFDTEPRLLAALAGDGRWLVNQFKDPDLVFGWRSRWAEQLVTRAARRAERRRAARGGRLRIAAANASWRDRWAEDAPFLDPVVIPIAGARPFEPVPNARERLGIPRDRRVALLFGAPDSKRVDTVLEAFAALDDWTLVVGGLVADVAQLTATPHERLQLHPGIADNATRDLFLSAADLMVLSFDAGYERNSGTLMDAVSARLPIVCSRDSYAGAVVEEFGLGPLFEPGNVASLAEAVCQAPGALDREVARRAEEELSNRAVARQQLKVLGIRTEL
jgi:glycosyltransferase involved in cell wall biosynthesis